MAILAPWASRVAGEACPLDAPRPPSTDAWDLVAVLSVSSLYLAMNQAYRGHCQLVFDPRHVSRVDQLTPREWAAMAGDLYAAQAAIVNVVRPAHVNVESLGNVVPHLHWHIIPRYPTDPRWGSPIWDDASAKAETRLDPTDRAGLLAALRSALTSAGTIDGPPTEAGSSAR